MSRKIKLPNFVDNDIVCFHYTPSKMKNRIVLQIPTEDFNESSTHYMRMDNAKDIALIMSLKEGGKLYDMLRLYGHIAYKPETGECIVLEDKENGKKTTSRFHAYRVRAERKYNQNRKWPIKSYV